MEYKLCEYAKDISKFPQILLYCSIINDNCGNFRYCSQIKKPVMSNSYINHGCSIKNKYEKENPMPRTIKDNKNPFKVIADINFYSTSRDMTSIRYDFNGEIISYFIDGKYNGNIELEFKNSNFIKSNIKNIKQI